MPPSHAPMRFRGLKYGQIEIEELNLSSGQTTCFLGRNASGKSLIGTLITGETSPDEGAIEDVPSNVSLLSFESLQQDYEQELANDDTDFQDSLDYGTTGRELLLGSGHSNGKIEDAAQRFGISDMLDRGCRQFSTGELRRITLLKEILLEPDLLILDEPYEGLDRESQLTLGDFFHQLAVSGKQLLFLANRLQDVPEWSDRLIIIENGKIIDDRPTRVSLADASTQQLFTLGENIPALPDCPSGQPPVFTPLLRLTENKIAYGDTTQFEGLNWTLQAGEHTLITGPNGSGKSTLLSLLTGDHPQCYTNQIEIFGYQRGTGESIWDIKRHIGYLSPSLHRDYRVSCSLETVLVSGFHDSIGLYEPATAEELSIAHQWLEFFGLSEFANRPFRSLSYGQQRLALIGRALIKQPPLVIFDEPTQGLDDLNRHLVLACLERLASLERTTLLFVSHREDEHIPLFKRQLAFRVSKHDSTRFEVVKLG
ncbi:ATP-binding cassette domain-containing protein [Pelagicoccus mobilis]|uniref:ATP-binding cassette domain-containing protein n=1 Tax=Pelagicoccus mobilis TaxID=415221 RepID=A0A934RXA2_9BACT|nr:ATP-binding cassette domain-containing protein [Pelagicoccus mobilis]MBK1876072.1 ATP-binding cassette domain-containing protein [Pelagicoccus mobilis]